MVGPVDAEDDEAEDVGEEDRQHRTNRLPVRAFRDAELEHHDRDQNRDHAVAERLEPRLVQFARGTEIPIGIANVRSCDWMVRMFFGPIRSSCFCALASDSSLGSRY